MTLYILNFNNYYNRIVKRYETIKEYEDTQTVLETFERVNFNPNNGIYTEHVINYEGLEMPNYLIVVDEEGNIESRWFITQSQRTRAQQFNMKLFRDVIADWYNDIISAPVFIEKATVGINDPAIFNNESMTFNQIKTKETLLKDDLGIPWIVGYVARDYTGGQISVPAADVNINYTEDALSDYAYYNYNVSNPYSPSDGITQRNFRFNLFNRHLGVTVNYATAVNNNGQSVQPHFDPDIGATFSSYVYRTYPQTNRGYAVPYTPDLVAKPEQLTPTYRAAAKAGSEIVELAQRNDWTSISNSALGISTNANLTSDVLAEEGKIIKAGDVYYRIHVNALESEWYRTSIPENSSVGLIMQNIVNNCPSIDTSIAHNQPVFEVEYESTAYYFSFEAISVKELEVTLKGDDRAHLNDAPYDMFAIPYGKATFNIGSLVYTNKEAGLRIAAEITKRLGNNLYDIQLLPYAPIELQRTGGASATSWFIDSTLVDSIMENDVVENFVVWLSSSSFTRYLNHSVTVPTSNIDFKVANECDMHRLCSPNYNGTFEFTATKNRGVSKFRVDCRYKPYQPYIRVAPSFNGLYGTIEDDARGLICNGDFSLSQITDAWQNYQIQNKNFQQIFDRQIENMEFNNSIQRTMEAWNVSTGTLSTALQGGMVGNMIGGPLGAGIGAGASAALSLAGGIADMQLNEQIRREALDYTKDQFGYQLGNIRALPQSLTKVSSFNPNNKIFPVLEYYTCTTTEKEALRNKIKYNGMTIMRIGTIQQFIQTEPSYIKGKLIRLDTVDNDFNIVNTIADELFKGVFI